MSQGPCKTHCKDKSSPRYRVDAGTYSIYNVYWSCKVQGHFEYSTNAIINQQKSYRHPALRESALAYTVYGASAILVAKIVKIE